jgi:ParB family chromosome partitioning protein
VFVEGELSKGELLAQQLIENLLREDLRAVEEAKAFRQLLALNAWTGKQLADALRIPASKVTRSLALLALPDDLQERVEAGDLAARSAYEIAKLPGDDSRRELARAVEEQGLTTEDARRAVRSRQGRSAPKGRATRERFSAPGGLKVTVSACRSFMDAELEAALTHVLGIVRARSAAAIGSDLAEPI